MNRKKKDYYLSEKSIEYIEEFKEKNNCKYNSEALELIIKEHEINSDMTTEMMIKIIGDRVAEKIKTDLTIMKKACNSSDKNTQILLEMLNGYFIKNDVGIIATTDIDKSKGLERATKVVKERIENNRIKVLDKTF